MAKRRHEEPPPASSRATLLVLVIGGLAVAGLLVWALTRTVETPAPVADTAPPPLSAPAPATSPTPTTTMPTGTIPLTATQTPSPFPTMGAVEQSPASVPRISVEDLREQMRANAVTIIDVRDAAAYAGGHIPGALHIPFAQVEGEMATLPKGKPVVTYCS